MSSGTSSAKARRTAARLAAVQSLYQQEVAEASAARAVYDSLSMPQAEFVEPLIDPDRELLSTISEGIAGRLVDVDSLLQAAMEGSRQMERTEPLMRAILRAGAYELLTDSATANGIIINDYVNVAHAFFNEGEPKKVNAVLDRVCKQLDRQL